MKKLLLTIALCTVTFSAKAEETSEMYRYMLEDCKNTYTKEYHPPIKISNSTSFEEQKKEIEESSNDLINCYIGIASDIQEKYYSGQSFSLRSDFDEYLTRAEESLSSTYIDTNDCQEYCSYEYYWKINEMTDQMMYEVVLELIRGLEIINNNIKVKSTKN